MSYTHHISLNGSDYVQVYPTNSVEITTEQEPNCIFHRDKVNEVKINKAKNSSIYDSLETYFTDKTKFYLELEYEIYKGARTGTPFYKAVFSVIDCLIDLEKKYIEIPMRTNDQYREVMDQYESQFNLASTVFDKQVGVPSIASITWNAGYPGGGVADYDTFTEGASPGILSALVNTLGTVPQSRFTNLGNVVSQDVIITRVKAYSDSGATGIEMHITNSSGTDMSIGGPVAITGTGYYAVQTTAATPLYYCLYAPALFNGSVTIDIWVVNNRVAYGAMSFPELTAELIDQMGLTLDVSSTILDNDTLPTDAPSSIDSWITSYSSGNYVTQTQTENRLNNFNIGNAKRWDDAYEDYNLSLADIMTDLSNSLQMYWYIDEDGDFRIEHKMYFDALFSDSTAILTSSYSAYDPEGAATTYKAQKETLVAREEFAWVQNTVNDSDFNGLPIIYNVFETAPNVLDHNLGRVTTDIDFLVNGESSLTGWVYYDLKYFDLSSDIYVVDYVTGTISTVEKLNAYFSWGNLHPNFWTYGRMSENVNINGSDITADTVVPFLEQEGVRFPYSTAIPWYNEITTSFGSAMIISQVRQLDSDFISFKLSYNPYE